VGFAKIPTKGQTNKLSAPPICTKNIFDESEEEIKNRTNDSKMKELSDRISDMEIMLTDIIKQQKRFEKQIEKLKKKKGEDNE
jgi:hypothetical protein